MEWRGIAWNNFQALLNPLSNVNVSQRKQTETEITVGKAAREYFLSEAERSHT